MLARVLEEQQPGGEFCYWGDTACGGWGSRSPEFVWGRAEMGMKFLQEKGATTIVMASGDGSAASRAEPPLITPLPESIIDYWDAQVKAMEGISKTKRIGVIGSRLAIGNFGLLNLEQQGYTVYKKTIPALAPLIIEGEERRGEMRRMVRAHLQWFKIKGIDVLLLGSISYARMIDDIQAKVGKRVKVIDPVGALSELFNERRMGLAQGEQKFYLTDMSAYDQELARKWLGRAVEFERGYKDALGVIPVTRFACKARRET